MSRRHFDSASRVKERCHRGHLMIETKYTDLIRAECPKCKLVRQIGDRPEKTCYSHTTAAGRRHYSRRV